jgi:DNA-binding Lrp family transcriptional regulator
MDRIDRLILSELMQNSRMPIKMIAKKIKASREVITYRLNKLVKDKVVLNFTTEINYKKLGFLAGSIYLNLSEERQKEFIEFLSNSDYVSWAVELSGTWNFAFSILGKTTDEIDYKFQQMYNQFKDSIINHRFTLHKREKYFYEKYFDINTDVKSRKLKKEITTSVDSIDKHILKELTKNSRIELTELSKKIKITPPAISKRIKRLEDENYILRYYLFVDVSKLNLYQYEVLVVDDNKTTRDKLINHLEFRRDISYVAEYVGDPYLEFGLFVSSPYELRKRLQEILGLFKDIRVIQIDLFQQEIIPISPPDCVFE